MRAVTRASCVLLGALVGACDPASQPPAGSGCTFRRTDVTVGVGSTAVAVADFNEDGAPDLAVTNNLSNTVSVLIGSGGGKFLPKVDYATGGQPFAVTVADLDKNGILDLAIGNGGGGVSVLLGNGLLGVGDGTFQAKVDSPPDPALCRNSDGIASGDFNKDGNPDLIVANDLPSGPATATLLLGNGTAAFGSPASFPTGNATESVAVGDFNGDGNLDVATANLNSSNVTVLLGNGAGGFPAGASYVVTGLPYFVTTADLNGDGKLDLVTANLSSKVSVLLGNSDGTFKPEALYGTGLQAYAVAVADLDGDGKLDLATADYGDGTASVLLGNGNGTFQPRTSYAVGPNPFSVAVADLDGNGKPDLVLSSWSPGSTAVSVLLRSCGQ